MLTPRTDHFLVLTIISLDFDTFFRKQVFYIDTNLYIFIIENIFVLYIYIFCSVAYPRSSLCFNKYVLMHI